MGNKDIKDKRDKKVNLDKVGGGFAKPEQKPSNDSHMNFTDKRWENMFK